MDYPVNCIAASCALVSFLIVSKMRFWAGRMLPQAKRIFGCQGHVAGFYPDCMGRWMGLRYDKVEGVALELNANSVKAAAFAAAPGEWKKAFR
jgi:hypothetical protein